MSDNKILHAIQINQASLLTKKTKSQHSSKKAIKNQDLNLIRSNGRKRKFFLKDLDIRKNLNKRQKKLLNKALKYKLI